MIQIFTGKGNNLNSRNYTNSYTVWPFDSMIIKFELRINRPDRYYSRKFPA